MISKMSYTLLRHLQRGINLIVALYHSMLNTSGMSWAVTGFVDSKSCKEADAGTMACMVYGFKGQRVRQVPGPQQYAKEWPRTSKESPNGQYVKCFWGQGIKKRKRDSQRFGLAKCKEGMLMTNVLFLEANFQACPKKEPGDILIDTRKAYYSQRGPPTAPMQ